ncbi:uncharacterized protein BJ212DRAFT_1488174 [Suillus subaureus]|uniref:Myb-like domain-containing protein n=1 Tax=Suillus subaureus TaxID=48587 RepID=A0A9P7DPN8_9AGAM|nr:uncharacterized protein BJ212DRAFT_1488174 [Suillus subaureus]KAG1799994.1 hypothetical protein BJ212DRAFT_1488174 [Suillus subaureus]
MIEDGESKQSKAQWSEEEVDGLLSYLQLQVLKIVGVTFRDETFCEAAKSIAHLSKQGLPKDMAQCKRKWKVFIDASTGNKIMKPFKTNGWRYWEKMSVILLNGSGAHGGSAYNPASLAVQASGGATASSAEASGSMATTTSTASSGRMMGLDVSVPKAATTGGAHGLGWGNASLDFHAGWDQVVSALPSITPGITQSSMNVPPPPSSVAPSSTSKHSHSDMVLSSNTTQTSASQVGSANANKKPRLSAHGGSPISCVASNQMSSKAAKDAASTAAFINLQGSINCLTDSLHLSVANSEETRVVDERSQALAFMQDEEGILPVDQITLMNVFSRSPVVCSTYLSAKVENCVPYLQSVLVQAARGDFGPL